ncbi:4'-phosphopantetheinyl transferase superfamily protein [Cohnella sp. SGD-V74]|nr:4'-phosphopantetheinyl transferase superfamily protein [Cohnella sp. SGD-V74]
MRRKPISAITPTGSQGDRKLNEIQLYVVPVRDEFDLGKLDRRLDLLDEEELQVYRRYQVDFKKVEFAIGRILLKTQLAQRIGADPRTIHFRKNQYGKLYLPEHDADITSEQLFFNLSHTDKLIVCAMTTLSDIGVDVERLAKDHLTIMSRVFNQAEIDYVNEQQGEEEKLNAFYMVWTRKEAHMKAKGMGFSLPPLSFSVPVRPGRAAQGEWEYYTCRLRGKYMLSTALHNPTGCDIQYRIQEMDYEQIG